jgi:homoserine O-acetyltransferase
MLAQKTLALGLLLLALGCAGSPPLAAPAPECAASPVAEVALAPAAPVGKLGDLQLASGETIKDCQIEYRTLGTLNADRSNVVVWATWFSGLTSDLVGLAGPGKLVDSTK